jgi:hypothetical protein
MYLHPPLLHPLSIYHLLLSVTVKHVRNSFRNLTVLIYSSSSPLVCTPGEIDTPPDVQYMYMMYTINNKVIR